MYEFYCSQMATATKVFGAPISIKLKAVLGSDSMSNLSISDIGNGDPWEETAAGNGLNVHLRPLTYQDSHLLKLFCVHACVHIHHPSEP